MDKELCHAPFHVGGIVDLIGGRRMWIGNLASSPGFGAVLIPFAIWCLFIAGAITVWFRKPGLCALAGAVMLVLVFVVGGTAPIWYLVTAIGLGMANFGVVLWPFLRDPN